VQGVGSVLFPEHTLTVLKSGAYVNRKYWQDSKVSKILQ